MCHIVNHAHSNFTSIPWLPWYTVSARTRARGGSFKARPVRFRGPWCFLTSRLPHQRLTDGSRRLTPGSRYKRPLPFCFSTSPPSYLLRPTMVDAPRVHTDTRASASSRRRPLVARSACGLSSERFSRSSCAPRRSISMQHAAQFLPRASGNGESVQTSARIDLAAWQRCA